MSTMGLRTNTTIFIVFFSCCANVILLEKLVTDIPGVANLITFLQFLFISLEGFLITAKCGTRKPSIPISCCVNLVCLFFLCSISNNYAYNFNVPTTLHIIIKSGSLVTNMVMGIIIRNRQYPVEKYISVTFITAGIITCTVASANTIMDEQSNNIDLIQWCIGVTLLIFALVLGAAMGLLQESLYLKYGKHPSDVLFYTHVLPLPFFIFLINDLSKAVDLCNQSSTISFPFIHSYQSAWILLTFNVLTQYVCIRSVYILTSECTSLTVTLVLTLRKFVSLLISVILFKNSYNLMHWVGTSLVFLGTCLYLELIKIRTQISTK